MLSYSVIMIQLFATHILLLVGQTMCWIPGSQKCTLPAFLELMSWWGWILNQILHFNYLRTVIKGLLRKETSTFLFYTFYLSKNLGLRILLILLINSLNLLTEFSSSIFKDHFMFLMQFFFQHFLCALCSPLFIILIVFNTERERDTHIKERWTKLALLFLDNILITSSAPTEDLGSWHLCVGSTSYHETEDPPQHNYP